MSDAEINICVCVCMQALNWDSNEKPLDLLLSFSIPAGISAYSFIDVLKLFQRLFWGGQNCFIGLLHWK